MTLSDDVKSWMRTAMLEHQRRRRQRHRSAAGLGFGQAEFSRRTGLLAYRHMKSYPSGCPSGIGCCSFVALAAVSSFISFTTEIFGTPEIALFTLGPVDNHVAATTPATRWIPAAKLASVLSYLVATARNSLVLAKKFSTWCRHPYISRSCSRGSVRFRLDGITGTAPRLSTSSSSQSASNALSPTKAPNGEIPRQRRHPREGRGPGGKDHEADQVSERVHDRHDLARQAAPGAADPLPAGPPFAPAAFW